MANDISASADVVDVRDIIERFTELEDALIAAYDAEHDALSEDAQAEFMDPAEWYRVEKDNGNDDAAEFLTLQSLLDDLAGSSGDEQWRGDWYPVTLIHDMYFEDYARDLAEEIGDVKPSHWPYTCIDWAQAARELQADYSTVEYDGSTFWYR